MNIYELLVQANHDYHALVETVLLGLSDIPALSNVDTRVNLKNEFAARAADVINSMNRANQVLAPYFKV